MSKAPHAGIRVSVQDGRIERVTTDTGEKVRIMFIRVEEPTCEGCVFFNPHAADYEFPCGNRLLKCTNGVWKKVEGGEE